ncbi:MAG: PQQ-dependent sugar dehydrogenase [Opitutaceae bacterium]|nr:PQQ-dependent sugar dehydrogenase [Opitutaceae bacterium]
MRSPQPRAVRLFLLPMVVCLSAVAEAQDVRRVYQEYCASCHGPNLEGGLGGNLVDDVWKHGADDENIARVIRDGLPDAGMPGFGATLNDAQVRSLVVYILEMGTRAAMQRRDFNRPTPTTVSRREAHAFKLEVITDELEVPWSIAFLPDGRMLVTERAGRLRVIDKDKLLPDPIRGTPEVWARGQGGLLAVAVHPAYRENGWVYLAYSDPGAGGTAMTAIVRGRIRAGRWADEEAVFRIPESLYKRGGVHFGCRMVFHDGYLFFTHGERGAQDDAQDLTRPNGKVHRLHDDGRVPEDNPFANEADAFRSIWSYGNRNPQGLAWRPGTDELWETEHGPRGGDELNLIRAGRNYGWPVITYGMNYNGTPITGLTAKDGMEQPVIHWTPSIAVGDMAFYDGKAFPKWKGNLFVTALAAEEVRRLVLEGDRVTHQEILFKGIGRVRSIAVGPDGFIYLGLENPGRIVRLVSAE